MTVPLSDAPNTGIPSTLAHSVAVVLVVALICLPCIRAGIPPGFDSEYHTAYQYHVSRQFWTGDLYPRWLAGANKGYGSPIFLVQYPLPYLATALLRPIVSPSPASSREARELGMFCFLVLAGAGIAARAWFRNHCAPWAATLAAIVYVVFPYVAGQALYRRAALGELCSFLWMPLALDLCHRRGPRSATVCAIGGVFALLVLSNGLSAALFLPLLVPYAIATWRSRGLALAHCATSVLVALALGTAMAAVYLIPIVAYRKLFDLSAMAETVPGFELGRWFVYATSRSLRSNGAVSGGLGLPVVASVVCLTVVVGGRAWRAGGGLVGKSAATLTLLLGVALLMPDLGPRIVLRSGLRVSAFETPADFALTMLVTGLSTFGLGVLAYFGLSRAAGSREQVLLAVAGGAFVLMMPWSAPLWAAIPALNVFQFPFRLCGVLTVAVAGLFAVSLDDRLRHRGGGGGRRRLLMLTSAALLVAGAGTLVWGVAGRFKRLSTADLAMARNVDVMFRSYVPREHLAGLAARLGASIDSFEVTPTPIEDKLAVDFTEGEGVATATRVGPRELHVRARCGEEARVRVGQIAFPLWRLVPLVPSTDAAALGSSDDGLIEVSLPPGEHDFELLYALGWPERSGVAVTLASLVVALGACVWGRLR